MSHARAGFGTELASVGEARRFARRALVDLGAEDLEFEACQVVSELATNAAIHAATPFEVEFVYDGDELQINVSDGSPRAPVTKSHSDQATTGRGLRLVGVLADEWGVRLRPDGKTVWCTLRPGRNGRRALSSAGSVEDGEAPSAELSPTSSAGERLSDASFLRLSA
jgi:anti-sigma regulatory factor (Ser/Thr protein kinase)